MYEDATIKLITLYATTKTLKQTNPDPSAAPEFAFCYHNKIAAELFYDENLGGKKD